MVRALVFGRPAQEIIGQSFSERLVIPESNGFAGSIGRD